MLPGRSVSAWPNPDKSTDLLALAVLLLFPEGPVASDGSYLPLDSGRAES